MTWSLNRDLNYFWPLQFLPQEADIRDTRILSFGYNADFRPGSGKTKASILDFSKDLLYDLKFAQDESGAEICDLKMGEKPIIFVVHSMGGLLIKEAYLQGQNDPTYQDIVKAITSIIFLSTPHRGTHLAETLNRILQVSFVTSPMQFIAELIEGSQTLQKLNEQFRHVAPKLRIVSFYETRPTPIAKKAHVMVLEKDSSVLGYPGEISKPLDADHHGVCKYESRDDPRYVTVRNALKSLIGKADPSPPAQILGKDTASNFQAYLDVAESPEKDYNFFRDQWVNGTCAWLLSHEAFESWINANDHQARLLWIHGNAASGKSVLSSFVVEHLVQSGLLCGYFFVRYSDLKKRAPSLILRSIACQIAANVPAYAEKIRELEAVAPHLKTAHFRLVWQSLYKQILLQLPKDQPIYLVLDGLDEADHPGNLIKLFGDLQLISWPLRILLVSRKTHEISSAWLRLGRHVHTETIPLEGNSEDFRSYISQEMDMADDEAYREEVTQRLLERARGNFLWVHLTVQKINGCYTTKDIEEALTNLPPGMENLYNRMAQAVQAQASKDGHRLGMSILGWAACAQRLLSVDELGDALSSEGLIEMHRTIGNLCGGFVVVDIEGKVSMVHETARDYLMRADQGPERPFLVDKKASHMALFQRCITRLTDPALRSLITRNRPPGLLDYAASYWFIHLSHCNFMDPHVLSTTAKFFKGRHILTWISIAATAQQLKTLVVASRYLTDIVQKLRRAESGMPLDFRQAIDVIDGWATDMVKIVGKFGDRLIKYPDSILKLIPPFCPETSMIYQQFGRRESKSLQVSFSGNSTWDDCLARFSMDEGLVASAVVTGGSHIAILATVRCTSHIYLYNSHTFERQRCMNHPERVFNIHLDRSGKVLVSYGYLTTRVWDVTNGKCLKVLTNPDRRPKPHTMVFFDEGKRFIIGSEDRCVRSFSLDAEDDEGWKEIVQIEEQNLENTMLNFPMCSALSPDGTMIAYGYRAYPMTVWELEPANLIAHCSLELDSTDMTIQENTFGEVFRVAWHPLSDDREVFGLTQVGLLFKWSPYEDVPSATVNTTAHNMAVSEDGVLIATGDALGTVKVFATADLSMLYQLSSQDPVMSIIFSTDSRRLYDVRGSYGNVWQPNTLARIADTSEYPDHNSDSISEVESFAGNSLQPEHHTVRTDNVITIAGQSVGSLYCYGTEDGIAALCEVGCGKIMELERLESFMPIEQVAWSVDGKLVCIAQLGGKLSIKRVLRAGVNGGSVEVQQQLELQLPPDHGHITQLIFHSTRYQLLISTPKRLFLLDIVSSGLKQTDLSQDIRVRWVSHSALPDYLLGFDSTKMHIYEWSSLKQLISETRTYFPPRTESRTSTLPTGPSLFRSGTSLKAEHDFLGRLVASDTDSSNILLQLWSSYTLDQVKPEYLIFDVDEVVKSCNEIGDDTLPNKSGDARQLSYSLLPTEVASCIREPLACLSRGRLVFLDIDRWICTWRLPSAVSRASRVPTRGGGGFRRAGGDKVSSHSMDINGVEMHYFLPGDWVTADEAHLCEVMTDGTLLCPRHGDVAAVQCARLRS
ncbi:hypothetical protein BKA67DRAFT_551404 [Truncatella angustata]|uniref:NACHT domain-containing protein n=1 Tax=Truncatella angustata TaxID=152316 RepID=A0A9P8ZZK3_9PEZI|nr:uncharacterized protein BKA67DRAFT_551404 [Truncatella angustata]KAH6656268.1 hypothetical protein BKA67DRAFT_551404 [Truncatella angustata]